MPTSHDPTCPILPSPNIPYTPAARGGVLPCPPSIADPHPLDYYGCFTEGALFGIAVTKDFPNVNRIRALDQRTINQIAAGEVIDRPASVVKELVENALDAGASHIEVALLNGGLTAITVTDNGHGIHPDDLPLALQDHATSKITALHDLLASPTMGFRGEALSSIREIARIQVVSRPHGSDHAWRIHGTGGEIASPMPDQHQPGTSVRVTDLFYNTPVRHRFLKSPHSELNAVLDVIRHLALCWEHVSFDVSNDHQPMLSTVGLSIPQRIGAWWGHNVMSAMVPIDAATGSPSVSGWVSRPTLTVPNRNKLCMAINRRIVKTPLLYKAVSQAYADVIPAGRFPVVALCLTLPLDEIDVNVHPQKWDIKMVRPNVLFDAITTAIRDVLQNQPHHPHVALSTASPLLSHDTSPPPLEGPLGGMVSPPPLSYPTQLPTNHPSVASASYAAPPSPPPHARSVLSSTHPVASQIAIQTQLLDPPPTASAPMATWQLLDTYLMIRVPEGVWVLDQHAAHERMLYERLKHHQPNEQQALLVPEIITWPTDAGAIEDGIQWLQTLGFEAEAFGPQDIMVRAVPLTLAGPSVTHTMVNLVDALGTIPDRVSAQLAHDKDRLQRMACRAAIKAGHRMTPHDTHELVTQLLATPHALTCPHGRPLAVFWGKPEFEKLFHRT